MNIIQQQDRLKSLPEEVLIEYIANPTGEVPTFLALGEIERRKVMRNKYAAQQAEQPPVSEQIVQESMAARMPRPMDMVGGLGRSNRQEALRRETAPQLSMPPSGITALPTPNVGQNYAQGGVVGYAVGGSTNYDDYTRGLTFSDSVGGYTEEDMIVDDEGITFDESQFAISDPYGPETSLQNAGAGNIKELTLSEALRNELAETDAAYGLTPRKDFYGNLREELEKDRDYGLTKKDIASDALIAGGLGIAAGTSANALENIAAGGKTGFESYAQGRKDLRDSELGLRKSLRAIDAAERTEGIAKRDLDAQLNYKIKALAAEQGLSREEVGKFYVDATQIVDDRLKKYPMGEKDPFYLQLAKDTFGEEKANTLNEKQKRELADKYRSKLINDEFKLILENSGNSVTTRAPGTTAFEAASRIRKIAN